MISYRNLAVETWMWNLCYGSLVGETWLWKHDCGNLVVEGIRETPGRHQGGIWEASGRHLRGCSQEASRMHPRGTQEAPKRHPGGTQKAPKRHPGGTQGHQGLQSGPGHKKCYTSQLKRKSSLKISILLSVFEGDITVDRYLR